MFTKEYDVFIATHELTNNHKNVFAEKLYRFLDYSGIKCFYFPLEKQDSYKTSIVELIKSRMLIFICTDALNTTSSGEIDRKFHYDLCSKLDLYYGLSQSEDIVRAKDAKVVVLGNKWAKGEEEKLHPLFMGRSHIYYKNEKECLEEILDWVQTRLLDQKELLGHIESSEVIKPYMTRTEMMLDVGYKKKLENAKFLYGIGISNTEVMRLEYSVFERILKKGGKVCLAFLDPNGKFTQIREFEENVKKGRIKQTTDFNLQMARDIYDELGPEKENFKVYLYDRVPRVNLMIIDDIALLQYYDSFNRGMYNPSFLIKKGENSGLYKYCLQKVNEIIGTATGLKWDEI